MKPLPKDIIEGTITAMAFGGKGILRHEGLVIFVPFTAIRDQVLVRIVKQKKNYAEGELVQILHPSPSREQPRCPYFGTCGGCQLQHMTYSAQMEYKRQSVEDALKMIGGFKLEAPVIAFPAIPQWHYRRHVSLTLRPENDGYAVGYIANDNHSLITIAECPIFLDKDKPLFHQLQEVSRSLKRPDEESGKVSVLKAAAESFIFLFHFRGSVPKNAPKVFQESLTRWPSWKGIVTEKRGHNASYGKTEISFTMAGLNLHMEPGAFIQNHSEQSLAIYQNIVSLFQTAGIGKVLDLYCGIGISSLMLAREGIDVVGVENNATAIRLAKQNARANQLEKITFFEEQVETLIGKLLEEHKSDGVLVNPPRIGLHRNVIQQLLNHRPEMVLYVSCMPATLARDLKELGSGYKIVKCLAFDMFPQTAHVETVVALKKL